ncbi:TonB-dependent receptor [Fodinibius salsisoli]|uniref:TonB-dependent receptor n=1 Tax=Fodinibius salsisoli TaxID=2820877 RepID=A0ABT3PSC0_9BACT|nr:carboxypeptidase-like regulatory domain-containing protein [Fodinibius salsisoli]MCW9708755.1 TonB-dependent receptor [Fodinibius salsisoli]
MKRYLFLFIALIAFPLISTAQINGQVFDAETNQPLPGANVVVEDTQTGTSTDAEGEFTIDAEEGDVLVISFVGYNTQEVTAEQGMEIFLQPDEEMLGEIVVSSNVIDIARARETPVAVSTITPAEISQEIGNQEFPEIMNKTPGAYATKQSGGYGDSRISLRGFDQNNTAFLINGQPVNDMENGWVYWSNWQGLTDVASGIQIQRGLGATNLAVPSVGGTISIFTKTAEQEKGGSVSQLVGNDGYTKTAASYNTGLGDNGWSASFLLSYWQGNGYVNNTSGEGWTYFGAVGYDPNDSHSFNLSVLGAGQWHHQRGTNVSIRDFQNFGDDGIDPRWNSNGGTLNGEAFNMERNFYNKPLATLNWDWNISDNVSLATSLYGSAGRGGGTGPRGNNYFNSAIDLYPFGGGQYQEDLTAHYLEGGDGAASRKEDGSINFDNVVDVNRSTTSGYNGALGAYNGQLIGSHGYSENGVNNAVLVRRASMNSHNWFGGISKLEAEVDKFTLSLGVDLRKYTGYHYRALNNLMGLDGYFSGGDDSNGNQNSLGKILESENTIEASPFHDTGISGPKIDYYNLGLVNWQGVNGMVEYDSGDMFTAVIQGGVSNQSYQREDFFDQQGNALSEKKNVLGGYVKGGANFNISDRHNVFANAGFISKQPLFDAVFPGFANDINPDLQNEQITSIELGYGYTSYAFDVNVNLYSTVWGNRFVERTIPDPNNPNQDATAQFDDVDQRHNGIEVETTVRPTNNLRLDGTLSVGDWKYTNNFNATLFDEDRNEIGTSTLYTDGVKVGDAAQFVGYLGADYRLGDWSIDAGYRYVDNLYANYSITDDAFADPDNEGALKLPSYGLVDLGSTFRFDFFGQSASLRVNVNNLFDTTYISESETNYHAASGDETWNGIHNRNFVWFGFGRTWNASLKYNF